MASPPQQSTPPVRKVAPVPPKQPNQRTARRRGHSGSGGRAREAQGRQGFGASGPQWPQSSLRGDGWRGGGGAPRATAFVSFIIVHHPATISCHALACAAPQQTPAPRRQPQQWAAKGWSTLLTPYPTAVSSNFTFLSSQVLLSMLPAAIFAALSRVTSRAPAASQGGVSP